MRKKKQVPHTRVLDKREAAKIEIDAARVTSPLPVMDAIRDPPQSESRAPDSWGSSEASDHDVFSTHGREEDLAAWVGQVGRSGHWDW